MNARRERVVVVAPIAGVALARHVNAGDDVIPGATLFELADPAAIELLVEIEDVDAMRVAPGLAVTITSLGGARGWATARSIGSRRAWIAARSAAATRGCVPRPGTQRVGALDATDAQPLGLRVEAHIALPAKQVETRVPRSAVEIRDGRARVEVPHYGLLADERAVELGIADAAGSRSRASAAVPASPESRHDPCECPDGSTWRSTSVAGRRATDAAVRQRCEIVRARSRASTPTIDTALERARRRTRPSDHALDNALATTLDLARVRTRPSDPALDIALNSGVAAVSRRRRVLRHGSIGEAQRRHFLLFDVVPAIAALVSIPVLWHIGLTSVGVGCSRPCGC